MNEQELLIPTKIIKSKRKSISLVIKNDGSFIVRAPLRCEESKIFSFIHKKRDWIMKKRLEQISNLHNELTFDKQESIKLLGREFKIITTNNSRVRLKDEVVEVPANNSKQKLINFLKQYAKKYFSERAELVASLFDFTYSKITISSAKTCWGSCSHNNNLHFTYKLIMCPEDVIDYIILHELCHTKIKNHSQKFWHLVEKCNPNYKTHEKWLKKNSGVIEII